MAERPLGGLEFEHEFQSRDFPRLIYSLKERKLHPACALIFSSPPAKADPQWMKRVGELCRSLWHGPSESVSC